MKLSGKIAVITGATKGLGLATAKLFVEQGAYVFITGRRREELDEAVKAIGKNVTGIQSDAGKPEELDRLFETVREQKGHIDILFASAGAGDFNVPIADITDSEINRIFDVNLKGTIFAVQKALPLMRDYGSIIMTGSIAHLKGFPGMSIYNASKAALPSLARTWMQELKHRRIRVNVLTPGPINTAAYDGADEMKSYLTSLVPLGRLGTPKEVATTALFLASDESSFVNGIELCVDGGAAQM